MLHIEYFCRSTAITRKNWKWKYVHCLVKQNHEYSLVLHDRNIYERRIDITDETCICFIQSRDWLLSAIPKNKLDPGIQDYWATWCSQWLPGVVSWYRPDKTPLLQV